MIYIQKKATRQVAFSLNNILPSKTSNDYLQSQHCVLELLQVRVVPWLQKH